MIEDRLRIIMLYDFYSELLTDKQKKCLELNFFEDWSLAEIAEELSVSRQAVHDLLKRVATVLEEYEKKLHLCAEWQAREKTLRVIQDKLRDVKSFDFTEKEKILELEGLLNGLLGGEQVV